VRRARIYIFDRHPIVRTGLEGLIAGQDDMEVCGSTGDREEAMARLKPSRPRLVMIGIPFGARKTLELIEGFRRLSASLPIIALSDDPGPIAPSDSALTAGATACLSKSEPARDILAKVRELLGLGRSETEAKSRPSDLREVLSDREFEVFGLIGLGMGTREIARKLKLNVKTIESYRHHLKRKLGLESSPRLVRHAVLWECKTRLAASTARITSEARTSIQRGGAVKIFP